MVAARSPVPVEPLVFALHLPRGASAGGYAHRAHEVARAVMGRGPAARFAPRDGGVTVEAHAWPSDFGPAGVPFVDLHVIVPRTSYALIAAEQFAVRLAESLRPWHGRVHTPGSAALVAYQRAAGSSAPSLAPPYRLPPLRVDPARRHPLVPLEVAWINLWSEDTCTLLGLDADDERLFASVRTTADGVRVLTLAPPPFDPVGRAEHAGAIRAVYARFPRIGDRDRP